MNNITIKGRLTRDPELKDYTTKKGETGQSCKFSVAVDRRFGEETDFFNCVAFGGLSKVIDRYFKKGSEIVVSGEMQCNPYKAKDGTKRYPWSLVVNQFDFCGSKKDKEGASKQDDVPPGYEGSEMVEEEDLPF